MKQCTACSGPLTLSPSAKDRAAKYGGKPSDYSRLFYGRTGGMCSPCFLAKREADTLALVRRLSPTEPA
jgi:hypothetical protein